MMKKNDISAFIIAYNDSDSIGKVIDGLTSVLPEVTDNYEIIIVLYEGSNDGTERIVKERIVKDAHIRLVSQPRDRKGYGVALQLGISNSRYGLVFYTDGDNQYDAREIKLLLGKIEGADIVSGYRAKRRDPRMRLVTASVYNWLINRLFSTNVRDVDSAFKIYRKEVLDKIKIICQTGLADAEILARARRHGARIVEVPISHFERETGKPVFEISALGKLGFVHPRVVRQLLREMLILKGDLHTERGCKDE
jgi:glycosyltransferase involved in cell wall biosynthesis